MEGSSRLRLPIFGPTVNSVALSGVNSARNSREYLLKPTWLRLSLNCTCDVTFSELLMVMVSSGSGKVDSSKTRNLLSAAYLQRPLLGFSTMISPKLLNGL